MRRARILIVEDEYVVARDIEYQLLRIGHEVVGFTALAEEAADLARSSGAELVLMDIRLDGARDGVDAAREVRERHDLPVIFLTAYADDETLERAAGSAPVGYLIKPFDDLELRTAITLALIKNDAERELRASERRYAVTLASLGDAVIATDARACVTLMNPVAEALTGVTAARARGRPLREIFRIFDEHTCLALEEPASRVLRGQVASDLGAVILQTGSGRETPIDGSAALILDGGKTTGVVLVFRDASPARLALEASSHRVAKERMELALRGSKISVFDFDMLDGDLRNATLHSINLWEPIGHDPERPKASFERHRELWHPEDRERAERSIQACIAGEASEWEIECRVRHSDGSYRWRVSRAAVVRDERGKAVRLVGSSSDITERKQLELELRQAKEAAEAANRAKDEFLANVSHEIRTPMNAILGMTCLVLETGLTAEQRNSLSTVRHAAGSLLGIINDLLDFAKIEAGKVELERAEIALRELLDEIWRALSLRAHRKGQRFVLEVDPAVPKIVVGDAARLKQVLVNLVDNAIKFTERGEITITVKRVDAASERHVRLSFSVRDTGIGIAAANLNRIFGAFEQEDASATRRFGGTGLGLTIAARAVALMGGTIAVTSQPGMGSRFHFEALFEQPTGSRAPASLAVRVLVFEPNAVSRGVLHDWLVGWGMTVCVVDDQAALFDALWHGVASGERFDALLLSTRAAGLDLPSLVQRIRSRRELTGTRLIALGTPLDGEPARSLMDAHLQMPVLREELREALRRFDLEPSEDVRAAPVPRDESSLRVLVAEDNQLNAQFLRQLLTRRGHRLEIAEDGEQVLQHLASNDFDLLLLDLHMPRMSGFQVIAQVRELERATGRRRLPVARSYDATCSITSKTPSVRCARATGHDSAKTPTSCSTWWLRFLAGWASWHRSWKTTPHAETWRLLRRSSRRCQHSPPRCCTRPKS